MEEKVINRKTYVYIKCTATGEYFWKLKAEYNRCLKRNSNHKFFKDTKTRMQYSAKNGGMEHLKQYVGKYNDNLKSGNKYDKYSPFRYFLAQAKKRQKESKHKKFEYFDITLEHLYDLWNKQKGICSYTGIKMRLCKGLGDNRNCPSCASLDRIDSSKGYLIGNVQYVTQFVNLGKNKYSSDKIFDFFKRIS